MMRDEPRRPFGRSYRFYVERYRAINRPTRATGRAAIMRQVCPLKCDYCANASPYKRGRKYQIAYARRERQSWTIFIRATAAQSALRNSSIE